MESKKLAGFLDKGDYLVIKTLFWYTQQRAGRNDILGASADFINLDSDDALTNFLQAGINYLIKVTLLPKSDYITTIRKAPYDDSEVRVNVVTDKIEYVDRDDNAVIEAESVKKLIGDYLYLMFADKEVFRAIAKWKNGWTNEQVINTIKSARTSFYEKEYRGDLIPPPMIGEALNAVYAHDFSFRIETLHEVGYYVVLLKSHERAHLDSLRGVGIICENADGILDRLSPYPEEDWIERFGPSERLNEGVTEMCEYICDKQLNKDFENWYLSFRLRFNEVEKTSSLPTSN
jgi:hypothetical protein